MHMVQWTFSLFFCLDNCAFSRKCLLNAKDAITIRKIKLTPAREAVRLTADLHLSLPPSPVPKLSLIPSSVASHLLWLTVPFCSHIQ